MNVACTTIEKSNIDRFTSIINIRPADESWKRDFTMLVAALGLSYNKPESFADWFEDKGYQLKDGFKPKGLNLSRYGATSGLSAHPFYEGLFI